MFGTKNRKPECREAKGIGEKKETGLSGEAVILGLFIDTVLLPFLHGDGNDPQF